MEKYTFYKLPTEIISRMENGEQILSDDLEIYAVEEKSLQRASELTECVPHGQTTRDCICNTPAGPVHKTARCDNYYANQNGNWVYCYTRCDSCIYVCQST